MNHRGIAVAGVSMRTKAFCATRKMAWLCVPTCQPWHLVNKYLISSRYGKQVQATTAYLPAHAIRSIHAEVPLPSGSYLVNLTVVVFGHLHLSTSTSWLALRMPAVRAYSTGVRTGKVTCDIFSAHVNGKRLELQGQSHDHDSSQPQWATCPSCML